MINLIGIAVAGALSVDICPQIKSDSPEGFGDLIHPGRITQITSSKIDLGGPVANTGRALKKFGLRPHLVAKIGRDDLGRILYDMLNRQMGTMAADTIAIQEDGDTAYSVILAPEGLDRAILQNPGANDTFAPEDIDWHPIKRCKWFHFGHPSTMKKMYEKNDDGYGEGLLEVMKKAKEHKMITSLDLCAIDPDSGAGSCDWEEIMTKVLPYVDFFLPSIGDLDGVFFPQGTTQDPSADLIGLAEQAAEKSRDLGAGCVLIKLGEQGAYYSNSRGDFFRGIEKTLRLLPGSLSDWEKRKGHAPAVPAETIVSGLGAGDVTIAAYIACLTHTYDFKTTLRLAMTEGALSLSTATSTDGLVPLDELL